MNNIKRPLVGILVMALLIWTGFAPATSVKASSKVGAPTVKVKNTPVGADLKVTWTAVSDANGYVVYMGKTKTEYYEVGTTTDTSYTTSGLKKNETYYFKVYAYKTVGNTNYYGDSSKTVSGKTSKYPLYQVIDEGGQEVYFYWLWDGNTTVKDDHYNNVWNDCISILEERSADKTGEYPYGSNKTFFTGYSIGGKEVLRSTPHVNKGAGTEPTTATKAKIGKATSAKVKNTAVGADLKVTWEKVSGANGYDVYMSTGKLSGYKKVGTTTDASYTTNGLKKDKSYYFKVKAYTVVSINNDTTINNDKTVNVTVKVKKSYGNNSKVVSGKTCKYLLNTVIDEGGKEVYFYWLWDGKTAAKDEYFWNTFHKCEDILRKRYGNIKKKTIICSSKKSGSTTYSLNGKIICLSSPFLELGPGGDDQY